MKSEVDKRNVDTSDELLARILDVAVGTKKTRTPTTKHAIFAHEF
jgi:hypothetical protein